MDSVLVSAIDELIKPSIPNKSSLSGPDYVPVYSQDGASAPLNGSTIVRFNLPRKHGKVLATSKGQTGAFFVYTINANAPFIGEPWAVWREMRIFVNGTQLPANLYYHHSYSEWLKSKRGEWLNTDAENAGVNFDSISGFDTLPDSEGNSQTYVVPLPDNYSILTNKDHVFPLGELNIEVHCMVNNHVNFLGKATDGTNLTAIPTISDVRLYIPCVDVEPMVYDALVQRLREADEDETKMLLYPLQSVTVDAQTTDFGTSGSGSKNLIFNDVSSSVRLLMAKFSQDPGVGTSNAYKVSTGLSAGITRYNFTIDGKLVQQNDVTTRNDNRGLGYDLAYAFYKDTNSTYNLAVNADNSMGVIRKDVYDAGVYPTTEDMAESFNAYPVFDSALEKSFLATANLDTVSREDLIGGRQIIRNLSINLIYDNPTVGAKNSGPGSVNVYLIQHSNQIIGLSSKKCKLLK